MQRSLILVGPMGAGKTTIGRLLSQELALPFKDIDHLIVEHTGADIPWIFDVEGEAGFRKRETQMLESVLAEPPAVIATGGGIVTQPDNQIMLKEAGGVVYLLTPVKQQAKRTAKDKNRPLLQTENPEAVLDDLMKTRDPLYRDVADFIVSTECENPRRVANEIIRYWKKRG